MDIVGQLVLAIAFSAFFSGMEIAFISSSKLRFEMGREDNWAGRILSVFYRNPNDFIATMLVGNGIALVVFCVLAARLVESYILAGQAVHPALLLVVEILMTAFTVLVVGEFLPKVLFKLNTSFVLRFFSLPAYLFYIILYPVGRLAAFISAGILRISGIHVDKKHSEKAFTKMDLDYFIQSSIEESDDKDGIDPEIKIFQNALDFSNVKIRDCLVPRTEIIAVEMDETLDELKNAFIAHGISKVIVYKESIDQIVGYIHSSDLFKNLSDWHKSIRPVPIVPETMGAHKLMQLFLQRNRSLAVVVDEFGGTSGVVSMEDLVEEILGDIEDEHDMNSIVAKNIGENEYILSGRMEIEKVNKEFHLALPESDEYQTVGGLILHEYQSIPKSHEVIIVGHFRFTIIKVTATKIELVKLKIEK